MSVAPCGVKQALTEKVNVQHNNFFLSFFCLSIIFCFVWLDVENFSNFIRRHAQNTSIEHIGCCHAKLTFVREKSKFWIWSYCCVRVCFFSIICFSTEKPKQRIHKSYDTADLFLYVFHAHCSTTYTHIQPTPSTLFSCPCPFVLIHFNNPSNTSTTYTFSWSTPMAHLHSLTIFWKWNIHNK